MIVELGHFFLVLALGMALLQVGVPVVARPAAQLQSGCLLVAFAALIYAFVMHDYTLAYVAANSNSQLPLRYRVTAVWGAHEGSMLLWILILAGWTLAVSMQRGLEALFARRVLAVLGLISAGFLLFLLFTSNPFLRHVPASVEGADLNPLLQDFGMIVHPPILYAGYVGFAVPFAFAVAALWGGGSAHWVRWCRPWAVLAWVFLTTGIALGSWWAYYELGWGGWWFWDPVENASFMPWLLGTALVHSLAVTDRRGHFESWTLLLAISTFTLSILGTFLVRSGVLTSVHAFATDPTRGVFVLVLIGLVAGGALVLYAWRAPGRAGGHFHPASRETFLLCNSVLLTISMLTIMLGTLYPLVVEAMGAGKLSVGTPYFNAVFVPLAVPVILLMGLGMMARWQGEAWRELRRRARPAVWAAVAVAVVCTLMLSGMTAVLGVGLACWVLASVVTVAGERLRSRQWSVSFWGMCVAHIGLAVTVCGIAVSSQYSAELHRRMAVGEQLELAGYRFALVSLADRTGPNYSALTAHFRVDRAERHVATLVSEKRHYTQRDTVLTEAGIDAGLWRDLYVSLGDALGDGSYSVRLYYKPLVRWVWLGAVLMALGGLLTLWRRFPAAVRA